MHPDLTNPISQMWKWRLRNLPEVTLLINGGLEMVSPGWQLQGSVLSTPHSLVIPKGWSPGQTCLLRVHCLQPAWDDYTRGLSLLLRGHLEWLRDETEWGPGKMGDGRKEWGTPPPPHWLKQTCFYSFSPEANGTASQQFRNQTACEFPVPLLSSLPCHQDLFFWPLNATYTLPWQRPPPPTFRSPQHSPGPLQQYHVGCSSQREQCLIQCFPHH